MPIIASARSAQIQICLSALKAQNISGAPAINDCIYLPAAAFKFKRSRQGEEERERTSARAECKAKEGQS